MKKIALISCCKKKNINKCQARDMYQSTLFKLSYLFAKMIGCDDIYVLSAKYGLLNEEEIIEPYDETLNRKNITERRNWADKVIAQLKKNLEIDIKNDEFIILTGKKYYEEIIPYLQKYRLPLGNLPIGMRLNFLKTVVRN